VRETAAGVVVDTLTVEVLGASESTVFLSVYVREDAAGTVLEFVANEVAIALPPNVMPPCKSTVFPTVPIVIVGLVVVVPKVELELASVSTVFVSVYVRVDAAAVDASFVAKLVVKGVRLPPPPPVGFTVIPLIVMLSTTSRVVTFVIGP
jgi:hypothetical protein